MNKLIVLKPKETAQMLHCSYGQLMRMVRANRIPHYRIGTHVLFNKDKVLEWIDNGGTAQKNIS
ncbi:MAG: helix-turn-helix domain-containing protein [Clostridiales bacterium]|nr:helix-turn-helix domain-containing protein [Clostridiales bacterium]